MSNRKTVSDIEKIMNRNKPIDKKREIYRVNTSVNSIIMSTHL